MADLRISELPALAGANLASGDLLPVVDISASETKRITVQDAIGFGVTLIADATIPGAKIIFNSASIPGSALVASGVDTTQINAGAITAAKLANESTVDLVTTLPASGAFTGQLALDTDDLKIYCWDGVSWQSIKAAGSINSVVGTTAGVINIGVSTTGDEVTISATLDNTSAAAQFLAGPTAAAGAVGYRTIVGDDLPVATAGGKGAISVNGEGLRLDGNQIEINNDVIASGPTYSVVNYDTKGLITAGRAITGSDLPAATSATKGAVLPGTGLAVDGSGTINHSTTAIPGAYAKVTVDAQGHVSAGTTLTDVDIPNHSAAKLTTGTLDAARIGNGAIAGNKLANASTTKFGGAGSTAGIVVFPQADFTGQYFFDSINGDLYLWDGNAWQPITITAGEIIFAGTYNATTNLIASLTTAGTAAGLIAGSALPAASATNNRYYLVVSVGGIGTSPAPAVALAAPDMLLSNGTAWEEIDVSTTISAQAASNISFVPTGDIASNNVQTALVELDTEKLALTGDTMTGPLIMPLGSDSVPPITFTGDTNTGIYSPGADQLAVSTGGTGRLFIDNSGRVGIGTSSPGAKLHVVGSAGTNFGVSDGSAYGLRIDNGIAYGLTGSTIHGVDQTFFGSYQPLTLNGSQLGFASGGAERLRIDSSGRVGIGTSSPTTLLDVNADTVRVRTARTPASATATGATGEICWDANYIYVCTATNTWRRTAISSW